MMVATDILALNCYLRKKPEALLNPRSERRPHHTQVSPWNSKQCAELTSHLFSVREMWNQSSALDILLLFDISVKADFSVFACLSSGSHWGAGGGAGGRAGHESQGMLHRHSCKVKSTAGQSRWAELKVRRCQAALGSAEHTGAVWRDLGSQWGTCVRTVPLVTPNHRHL